MRKKLLISSFGFLLICLHSEAQLSYAWDQSVQVSVDNSQLGLAWAGGINSAQASTMDLNWDGTEDLVIFDRTSKKISTFILSDNVYQYAPWYESFFPGNLEGWVLLRDFNCDGNKDLFGHTPFGIRVYQNISVPNGYPEWELVEDPIFTQGSSGQINLQVNILDLPGIDDLDGDGDLDILVYNFALGGGIEYHQNLSMENSGKCGLEFERKSKAWGDFYECTCDIFAFGENTCNALESSSRNKHVAGKSIMTLDIDNDGDKEILIGQEDCEPLYFLKNEGTPYSALMTDYLLEYPGTTNPIKYFSLPAAYYEDIDGDGLKDLISSPNFSFNYQNGIDFQNSFWVYKNTGSASLPEFQFLSQNYLQSEMIDIGESASPSFSDYDRDGDLDLFISNKGNPDSNNLIGHIYLFQNTGDASFPSFTLVSDDYQNISSLKLSFLTHQFADINGDGNPDLVLKGSPEELQAKIYILFNQSSSIYSFNLSETYLLAVRLNSEDNFHIADINEDQIPDLLIARSSGQLDYFRNIGSQDSPGFILDSEAFSGISANFSKKKLSVSVTDLDLDGNDDLLTIDERGKLGWYSSFLKKLNSPGTGEELKIEYPGIPDLSSCNFGSGLITTASIFNDAEPSIVIGLQTGGLQILRNTNVQVKPPAIEDDLSIIVFPNPSIGSFNQNISISSNQEGQVQILSYTGQKVSGTYNILPGKKIQFDTRGLPDGLYLIIFRSVSGKVRSKQLVLIN